MRTNKSIAVVGATGHTGSFVVKELLTRGWTPVLVGRDGARLASIARLYPGSESRVATIEDASALDHAITGVRAIIHCAGPFMDTAVPVVETALRNGIHYLDVTAEQPAALTIFERFTSAAADARIAVLPAMAFYGGLADLLATAAMGEWAAVDTIFVAIALNRWWPTQGTRLTGQRNTARRLIVDNEQLAFLADPPPRRSWSFPAPFDMQEVVELPFSEIITMSRHIRARQVRSYINLAPLADVRDPATPPPVPVDSSGRSEQAFVMDVVVQRGTEGRRATASGRDIYAVTAPLVVEATERILDGRATRVGTGAPGEFFDARDFLASLADHLEVEMHAT